MLVNPEGSYWDNVLAKDSLLSEMGTLGTFRMRAPSACENVSNAEFLHAAFAQRDVGRVRSSVFIVLCQVHHRNTPVGLRTL